MNKNLVWIVFLLSFVFTVSCSAPVQTAGTSADNLSEEIIALERSAIDRYITGDPQGYLDLYASEVTYFDPSLEKRIDGLEAMKTLLAPMRETKSPITVTRYEMISPKIQRHGDVVLLTFHAINYGKLPNQPETVLERWNSTEVYGRIDGQWKIIHSHWSYIKPEIKRDTKQPGA